MAVPGCPEDGGGGGRPQGGSPIACGRDLRVASSECLRIPGRKNTRMQTWVRVKPLLAPNEELLKGSQGSALEGVRRSRRSIGHGYYSAGKHQT